ncbi:AAA family ATPase [Novosphingobium aerophilum]|uniref:ATP-binding protein n=1 Tax=Novosphingobium aerophilum TaxID=2839843 RepID=UPI003FD6BE1D
MPEVSKVSVLLGKNGQGKSRLLSAIAISFQLLDRFRSAGVERSLPLARLEYEAGGHHHLIIAEASKIIVEIDGKLAPLEAAILPSRVIGLSMTPFDKFPIGNEPRQLHLFEATQPDVYVYLGMRERMGRSSSTALLDRAVEGLFARIRKDDRGRITHVFDMLGFTPDLTIVYRLELFKFIEEIAHGNIPNLETLESNSFMYNRIGRYLRQGEEYIDRLRSASQAVIKMVDRKFLSVEMDLCHPDVSMLELHEHMQVLRSAGLARLFAVEAHHKDGTIIDLKEASSGELSMAITFMSLAANLDNNALILIDEPETNLHPEWQAQYLDLLLKTFDAYHGCHYVLATHSPLILSDAPPSATIASLNSRASHEGDTVAGRAVDYLLVREFDVASGSNYYVQEELVKALRLAADGGSATAEFRDTVRQLIEIQPLIKDSPGVVTLITDLRKIAEKSQVQ